MKLSELIKLLGVLKNQYGEDMEVRFETNDCNNVHNVDIVKYVSYANDEENKSVILTDWKATWK